MEDPLDPLVCELVELLNDDQREAWNERAAVIEFDAGFQRAHAESLALLSLLARDRMALSRVRVLQFELHGASHCVLTTDLSIAHMHVGYIGGVKPRVVDLGDVLDRQHGGLASLCPSG